MTDDPGVRSVRVAVALCDRFAELLKGPTQVTARKQSGALFGVSGNQDDFSLRIAEVQQIYPEIWRHLDDARTTFAGRGVDVSAFDTIRASEGIALGANVDTENKRHGAGRYAVDEHVKTASFNTEGLARARRACDALMKATPTIDWAAIARAEAEDPSIAAFNRSAKTARWIKLGLLVAVIAAPFAYVGHTCMKKKERIAANEQAWEASRKPLSDSDRAEVDKAIAQARQIIASARQAWASAVAPDALAAIKPGGGTCEFAFQAPSDHDAERFIKYGNADGAGWDPFASYGAQETITDDQLARAARQVEATANRATTGYASRDDRDVAKHIPPHVLFLVIDKQVAPVPGKGTEYTPGEVVGRSYVFSVARKQIVCAGTIDVKNAPGQTTPPDDAEANSMLRRELEVRIRQALATGLHAI